MLLMKLKAEEKFAFLKLAYFVANIDGEFDTQEKDIIQEYCAEMGIENIEHDRSHFNLADVLKSIKTKESQTIVLLELLILVHSDDKYHRFEHDIIDEIAATFQISKTTLDIYSQWGKMSSALYAQGKLFLTNN